MDITNNLSGSPKAFDQRPQQSAPHDLPADAGFSGHCVDVSAGSSNMPTPPPPYSLHDPLRTGYSCPPPVYTPVANTPGLGPVSNIDTPVTLDDCLFSLDQAYNTDFTELADKLSQFTDKPAIKSPFWWMLNEVLNPRSLKKNSSKNLQQLAQTMWKFVDSEYATLRNESYSKLSQLTVVTCMCFLEQKINSEHQESIQKGTDDKAKSGEALTDCEHLLPALVRKTFFQKLLSAADHCHRGDAKKEINKFMQNNQSGLQDDMDCQYPVTGNLKFSGLLYEDIPGATISKKYIPQLDAFGHYYTIDLSGLVEALGQTRSKTGIFRDPLETVMQEVTNETGNKKFLPARFFNDRTEPFRDRNARCLLELMNYCQNQVFRQNSNTPGHEAPEMGEKCNDARRPLHESSAGRQQDTKAVKDKLRELLLNHSAHLQAVHSRLNEFFQKSQKPSVGSS